MEREGGNATHGRSASVSAASTGMGRAAGNRWRQARPEREDDEEKPAGTSVERSAQRKSYFQRAGATANSSPDANRVGRLIGDRRSVYQRPNASAQAVARSTPVSARSYDSGDDSEQVDVEAVAIVEEKYNDVMRFRAESMRLTPAQMEKYLGAPAVYVQPQPELRMSPTQDPSSASSVQETVLEEDEDEEAVSLRAPVTGDSSTALGLFEKFVLFYVTLANGTQSPVYQLSRTSTVDQVKSYVFRTFDELAGLNPGSYHLGPNAAEPLRVEFSRLIEAHPSFSVAQAQQQPLALALISAAEHVYSGPTFRDRSNTLKMLNNKGRVSALIEAMSPVSSPPSSQPSSARSRVPTFGEPPQQPPHVHKNQEHVPTNPSMDGTMNAVQESREVSRTEPQQPAKSLEVEAAVNSPHRRPSPRSPKPKAEAAKAKPKKGGKEGSEEGLAGEVASFGPMFTLNSFYQEDVRKPAQEADWELGLEDEELNYGPYNEFFHQQPHRNFLATDKTQSVLAISVSLSPTTNVEPYVYRVLLWTYEGTTSYLVPLQEKKRSTRKSAMELLVAKPKSILKLLTSVRPSLGGAVQLVARVDEARLCSMLQQMEARQLVSNYKFGVLLALPGQTSEEAMFSNRDSTPRFEAFLSRIGERVTLKGWTKYRGGLNVVDDSTGAQSVYTTWRNYGIMYHVSTLLPHSAVNPQQLDRKRHLGNDIVVVVFMDGDFPFDPSCISSEFNHTFLVVQPVDVAGRLRLRMHTAFKTGVRPGYRPVLLDDHLYDPDDPSFREFFVCKLINLERASYHAASFMQKIRRTKKMLLENVYSEVVQKN